MAGRDGVPAAPCWNSCRCKQTFSSSPFLTGAAPCNSMQTLEHVHEARAAESPVVLQGRARTRHLA